MKNVLAISSSKVGNSGYLEKAAPVIEEFLGNHKPNIAFIPFAFAGNDASSLTNNVRAALAQFPYIINEVNKNNAVELISTADVIMVSGGNTFKLLHNLYEYNLIELIQQKINSGTPYIGWSAGANLTGKTICTTNDMPIIEPKSFAALNIFPFQINPHYYNISIEGFHGETRDERLREFLILNTSAKIVCLPEGTALQLKNDTLSFIGITNGGVMYWKDGDVKKEELSPHSDCSYLMQ